MELKVCQFREGEHQGVGVLSAEATLRGLQEASDYRIACPGEGAQLFVDDAPLPRDASGAHWCWSPGYYAGEVAFELEMPHRAAPLCYVADIGPTPHKTGREQYVEYLAQIVEYAPDLLLGAEPAQHGLGGTSGTALSLWLRYARLRQFIERYRRGLQHIIERPIIRTRSRREQLALPRVRRVDGTTLRQLAQSPQMMAALSDVPESPSDVHEQRLDVPFHEPTFDNPANRLITRQLGEVRRLAKRLINDLVDYTEQASETVTDLTPRLPRRIKYLRRVEKQLARLFRQEPFSMVDTRQSSAAELNAVSGNPHYSMTHRLGVRLLRQGLSALANDEQHYLAPTWEIYEAWCFVALAQQLETQHPEYDWRFRQNPRAADRMLVGRKGEHTITLYSQLACPSMERTNAYGYTSISRERRPDLVLEFADSKCKWFICLDSKYSASKARILDAMASAHIYRDSLRLDGRPPDLSIILVPTSQAVSLLADEGYQARHGVGCVALSAAEDAERLMALLLA